jgi:hypothetical protein
MLGLAFADPRSVTTNPLKRMNLMKKIFALMAVSVLTSTAALAAGGDQYELVYDCKPEVAIPDNGLELQLLRGGIAGGTTIRTTRSFIGSNQINNYFVGQVPMDPQIDGAPVVYKGQGIVFSINFTTAPRPDGKRFATLKTKQYGIETVLCEVNR